MDLIKPYPIATPVTAPFWEALQQERVLIQRCADCGTWIFYPRSNCSSCLSENLEWEEVSGEGTLYTYTFTRQPTAPHFADEVPQAIAVIELDEGVRLTSTLIHDAQLDRLKVGARVTPVFDHVSENVTMLRYRLT